MLYVIMLNVIMLKVVILRFFMLALYNPKQFKLLGIGLGLNQLIKSKEELQKGQMFQKKSIN
jgi:hypothetical protein